MTTMYKCKYCDEIDDEQNIQDHMKCASRFMWDEITTTSFKLYFKPITLEEEDEASVRALYNNNFYRNHKPEIDHVEAVLEWVKRR